MAPATGWISIPLHPEASATIAFAKPDKGLAQLANTPPYTQLGFLSEWQKGVAFSKQLDILLPRLGPVVARAGQWVLRPREGAAYVEWAEFAEKAPTPDQWKAAHAPAQYAARRLPSGYWLAEPVSKKTSTCALFLKYALVLSKQPQLLEEYAETGLSVEIERQLPKNQPYGFLLHLSNTAPSDTGIAALPFYPLGRLATQARTLVLLPTIGKQGSWGWQGLASASVTRLRWPAKITASHKTVYQHSTSWYARIGQGIAGNSLLVGAEDSLAQARRALATEILSIRYVSKPPRPFGRPEYILELGCQDATNLQTILRGSSAETGPELYLAAPRIINLLGLPLPLTSVFFVRQITKSKLVLSTSPLLTNELTDNNQKPEEADLVVNYMPQDQWPALKEQGPAAMQTLFKTVPVTLSRLQSLGVTVLGDRIHIDLSLKKTPALALQKTTPVPFFTNIFNSPVKGFGQVAGHPYAGWAISNIGRFYLFMPGSLSFAQYQVDSSAALFAPVYVKSIGFVWQAGTLLYATDTTGKLQLGYPLKTRSTLPIVIANEAGGAIGYYDTLNIKQWKYFKQWHVDKPRLPPAASILAKTIYLPTETEAYFKSPSGLVRYRGGTPYPSTITLPDDASDFAPVWARGRIVGLAMITKDGLYTYHPYALGNKQTKQLYKPDPSAQFSLAKSKDGVADGIYRTTNETLTLYDLEATKKWEVPTSDPTYLCSGGPAKAWSNVVTAKKSDTLFTYNTLGKPFLPPIKTSFAGPVIWPSLKENFIAKPSGRHIEWYRLEP